jgi:hypothetical protein
VRNKRDKASSGKGTDIADAAVEEEVSESSGEETEKDEQVVGSGWYKIKKVKERTD